MSIKKWKGYKRMRLPVWVLEQLNNLTNCEMEMYLWLVKRQNSWGMVKGVRVSDFKKIMVKQSFYNALKGLQKKGLINFFHRKAYHDYDIGLMFSAHREEHGSGKKYGEEYINLNNRIFQSEEFNRLLSKEKFMVLMLYYKTSVTINASGTKAVHKKNRKDFYEYYSKLMKRSKRRIREYLNKIKIFFNVNRIRDNYHIGRNRNTYNLDKKADGNGKYTYRTHLVRTFSKRYGLKGVTDRFIEDVAKLYKNYIKSCDELMLDGEIERAIKTHSKDNNKTASAARVHQLLREGLAL